MFPSTASVVASKQATSLRVVSPPEFSTTATHQAWAVEWNGPVAATATAASALVLAEQHGGVLGEINAPADIDSAYQGDLSELIVGSMHWLARRQRSDGGWSLKPSDCPDPSDLMTSMIVRGAFQLTGAPAAYPDLGDGMRRFIKRLGGVEGLRATYGTQHSATLLALGCSMLAEVIEARQMPAIPIERCTFSTAPPRVEFWANRGSLLPAIVALGVARHALIKPLNPVTSWRRSRASGQAIEWLAQTQDEDGSFERSVPVTSLVLMGLASAGFNANPIVRRGVEFLFAQVRHDASWSAVPGSA
jgi:squalene-hopene/tetraprenyl-beta-curcumene cyclase